MKWLRCLCFGVVFPFVSFHVQAACAPCTPSYALQVNYTVGGTPQQALLTGSATVYDGVLDLNVGGVQSLLASQVGSNAILTDVMQITLNSGPPGPKNDTLLTTNGGVIAWVDSPGGRTPPLHDACDADPDASVHLHIHGGGHGKPARRL